MAEAALVIANLSKRYGRGASARLALDDLSLTVPTGSIFAFLGPNGAGKTTTLKAVLGLITPTHGSVTLLGGTITDRAIRARLGYLPEEPVLHPFLTVRDLLVFYGQLFGLGGTSLQERVAVTLATIGMTERQNQKLGELSKGLRQRVLLGQALINDPELILLDEPQSGLDPVGLSDLRTLLAELRAQGKTVFLNSHQLTEVAQVADYVALLREGKLVKQGALHDLMSRGRWSVVIAGLSLQAGDRVLDQVLAGSTAGTVPVTLRPGHEGQIAFSCADEATATAVMAVAQGLGGRLVSFGEEEAGLEALFFDLMGHQPDLVGHPSPHGLGV